MASGNYRRLMTSAILLAGSFLIVSSDTEVNTNLLVNTTHGLVQGYRAISAHGKAVDSFLGIPYGKPPIGELRFRPSVTADPWEGVFNATSISNACYEKPLGGIDLIRQFSGFKLTTDESEDCLKLNIWVPAPRQTSVQVMIYIHGGAFHTGSCSLPIYDGKMLSSEENIIVVCINYRLSSLGFLFLNHPSISGNSGLYDQLLGIKWVKDNIKSFGGDPDSITVFGESAGSASVGYLLLSPLNDNLFQRAILQSGVPSSFFASSNKDAVLNLSRNIVKKAGCPVNDELTDSDLECLKLISPVNLTRNQPDVQELYKGNLSPIPDGNIIPDAPKETLIKGGFGNFSVMIGNTANEGSLVMLFAIVEPISILHSEVKIIPGSVEKMIQTFFPPGTSGNDIVRDAAHYLYDVGEGNDTNYRETESFASDAFFICESELMNNKLAQHGSRVHAFVFDHVDSVKNWPRWMRQTHGDDVAYVFGEPLDPVEAYEKEEVTLSKRMMRMWANFARTGNPNISPDGSTMEPAWDQYTPDEREFVTIKSEGNIPGHSQRKRHCKFWNEHVPKLVELASK